MSFDPNLPQEGTPLDAVQMRSQLNALNDDIQQRATVNDLNNSIANALQQTSNNSNVVNLFAQGADGNYNPQQIQDLMNKVDELISALRR